MNKNLLKLHKLLSDILRMDADKINEQTSPDNTASWDSFNGLMIAAELEKQFDVSFDMEEVVNTKNVGDIIRNLKKHNIEI